MQYLGATSKMDRMISVCFQDKQFNITVIQVCSSTINAEDGAIERFYEDLQDLLKLTPKKDMLLIIGDWNAKASILEQSPFFMVQFLYLHMATRKTIDLVVNMFVSKVTTLCLICCLGLS